MEIYSHPSEDGRAGVLLDAHLDDVAQRVDYVVPEGVTTPAGEPLREVVRTLAYVHDFGKATEYFQQYLDDAQPDPENPLLRHHAPLGAFAAFYALDARGYATETCLAGFVAVAKHHGRLPDVAEYVYQRAHRREGVDAENEDSTEKRQRAIGEQLVSIDDHASELAEWVLEQATDGSGTWGEFWRGFRELLSDVESAVSLPETGTGIDQELLSEDCYALVLRCWSTLILIDKTSAAGSKATSATYSGTRPSMQRLNDHIEAIEAASSADPNGTRTERLNYYRSRARSDVLEQTQSFAATGGGVATLTLPTGMGKTLTGLSAAFDLRERIGGDRVVYALPFTSIIDQVVDELSDIYETDATGDLLTAHHHLAETVIEDDRDAEAADQDDNIGGMLAESWRAGLTVTTFVQLFESLAGPRNRQSMKLPALQDSIIVLDEPQSLPLDWWKLVPRLIEILVEEYDATVIAMTATQPKLFEDTDCLEDPVELIDDPSSYFDAVERVTYELDESTERYLAGSDARKAGGKSYTSAAAELRSEILAGQSVLSICNTIDSARELTKTAAERLPTATDVADVYATHLTDVGRPADIDAEKVADDVASHSGPAVLHLSTRLRPVDRLTLIEVAKHLTTTECPLLAITTQLVEAGVDISFDQVYRDLAPMDSIVQAAGRCNRSFEQDRGTVTVWWLAEPDEQQKTPAEAIYNAGVSLLPVTANALDFVRKRDGGLSETAVARDAVEKYYEMLHADRDVGNQSYAEYVDKAKADELGALSLIDQQHAVDVFVCRTDRDRELVEEIRTAIREYDFERLDALLDETKSLRISVPVYPHDEETADAIETLTPIYRDEGLYQLDVDQHSQYFDQRTGFVVPESTVDHQFL